MRMQDRMLDTANNSSGYAINKWNSFDLHLEKIMYFEFLFWNSQRMKLQIYIFVPNSIPNSVSNAV